MASLVEKEAIPPEVSCMDMLYDQLYLILILIYLILMLIYLIWV